MYMRMPETCWAVFKWQVINLRFCCIVLVDSVERFSPNSTTLEEMKYKFKFCIKVTEMIEEPVGVPFQEIPYICSFTWIPKETFMIYLLIKYSWHRESVSARSLWYPREKYFLVQHVGACYPFPLFCDFTKFVLKRSVRYVGKNFAATVSDCFVYTSSDEISLCNLLTSDAFN